MFGDGRARACIDEIDAHGRQVALGDVSVEKSTAESDRIGAECERVVLHQAAVERMTDAGDAQRTQVEKLALAELINSRLIIAKANRLGITAAFSEIEKMVDKAINDNMNALGGRETFERQLAAEGFTMDTLRQLYRDQIRNKMLVDRVLASEIDRGAFQISDEELLATYEERKSAMPNMQPEGSPSSMMTLVMG